jgi:glycogen synthase kinase 3 beta
MVHPFFDELRDPNIKLPDSRHANGAPKDMPNLFEFTHHGMLHFTHFTNAVTNT